jgi:hypothetical protein
MISAGRPALGGTLINGNAKTSCMMTGEEPGHHPQGLAAAGNS